MMTNVNGDSNCSGGLNLNLCVLLQFYRLIPSVA
jgi:hypothetical protein